MFRGACESRGLMTQPLSGRGSMSLRSFAHRLSHSITNRPSSPSGAVAAVFCLVSSPVMFYFRSYPKKYDGDDAKELLV